MALSRRIATAPYDKHSRTADPLAREATEPDSLGGYSVSSYQHPQGRIMVTRQQRWYHFHQDEIDRLDAAVERLFPELLER